MRRTFATAPNLAACAALFVFVVLPAITAWLDATIAGGVA